MERLLSIAALATLSFASTATAATDDLKSRATASDGWVAYHVPMIAGVEGPCCHSVRTGGTKKGCDLDGRNWSSDSGDDNRTAPPDDTLAVYLRVEQGRIERVRAVGASCPVQTASAVRWIDPADPASSVAMLSAVLEANAGDAEVHGLMALAYHAAPSATRALAARAEPSHSLNEREQALFWLGQTRGAEGVDVIEHYATTDTEPKLRAKAIFALSQSKAPAAYAHIVTIANHDPTARVRSEALFWLAQMDDPRAKDDIIASLKTESSDEVREQAVFALSQLKGDAADEALISIVRGDYSRSVKKRALFWLGQSGSPRAMAYFDEVVR